MNEQAPQDPIKLTTYRPHASQGVCPPALVSLRACITDLEQDWDTRPQAFWREVVSTLRSLFVAIDTQRLCTQDAFERNHLSLTQDRIDEIGILITAHSKTRRTPFEERLRERHRILVYLQELVAMMDEITTDPQE